MQRELATKRVGRLATLFGWRRPAEQPEPPDIRQRLAALAGREGIELLNAQTCRGCGGAVKVIACIEDPAVIEKILDHLKDKGAAAQPMPLPRCRAPPVSVFG